MLAGTTLGARIAALFQPTIVEQQHDNESRDHAVARASSAAFVEALARLSHAEPDMQADVLITLYDADGDARLNQDECLDLIHDFAEALYSAHAAGIVAEQHTISELQAAEEDMLVDMLSFAATPDAGLTRHEFGSWLANVLRPEEQCPSDSAAVADG